MFSRSLSPYFLFPLTRVLVLRWDYKPGCLEKRYFKPWPMAVSAQKAKWKRQRTRGTSQPPCLPIWVFLFLYTLRNQIDVILLGKRCIWTLTSRYTVQSTPCSKDGCIPEHLEGHRSEHPPLMSPAETKLTGNRSLFCNQTQLLSLQKPAWFYVTVSQLGILSSPRGDPTEQVKCGCKSQSGCTDLPGIRPCSVPLGFTVLSYCLSLQAPLPKREKSTLRVFIEE